MKAKTLKRCVIALAVVLTLVIIAIITLPIIINRAEQNEKNRQISNAEIIGSYVLDGIADNTLNTETVYTLYAGSDNSGENNLLPATTEKVNEIINSKKFAYAYAFNENYVLISEGAVFQQVNGYIVTNGNEEIGKHIEVPEEFNYDRNTATITAEVKENLYSFSAGL
ncbi:MAG: hypothetical protein UD936_07405 [Acutalibacteraceae bacterium]|nr:hypothetical protein [Acutalibacteraceae bacterium]